MKKMKKRNWLIAIGLLSLLQNTTVFAKIFSENGNLPGVITTTLGVAYYHFSSRRHLDDSAVPNFALSYNLTDKLAVEGGIGVINTNPTSSNSNGNRGVHGFLYTIDGIYRFKSRGRFQSYVIAGIGELGLSPIYNLPEHQGNVNGGIGTQLFFGDSVALRAELRDIYSVTGSGVNDLMANFGVSILFDGYKPALLEKPVSYKGEGSFKGEK